MSDLYGHREPFHRESRPIVISRLIDREAQPSLPLCHFSGPIIGKVLIRFISSSGCRERQALSTQNGSIHNFRQFRGGKSRCGWKPAMAVLQRPSILRGGIILTVFIRVGAAILLADRWAKSPDLPWQSSLTSPHSPDCLSPRWQPI